MDIPEGFQFSSSSLQDFEDCRYRFWLRYIQQVAWPAVQSEPAMESERRMQLGGRFHQLAQAYFSGVPAAELSATIQDGELELWWANFLDRIPALLPQPVSGDRYTEVLLSASLKGHRLLAKSDFICRFPDGSWRIYDWKTNLKRPARSWLQKSLQTRLYPFLLVRASAAVNQGKAISPGLVSMTYWFPAFPDQPESVTYSLPQSEMDEAFLSGLIAVIESLDESGFVKTARLETCKYCVYRSLCDRGTVAGDLGNAMDEQQDEPEVSFDFDQIVEISF